MTRLVLLRRKHKKFRRSRQEWANPRRVRVRLMSHDMTLNKVVDAVVTTNRLYLHVDGPLQVTFVQVDVDGHLFMHRIDPIMDLLKGDKGEIEVLLEP